MDKTSLAKLYRISHTLDVLFVEDDKVLQHKMQLILKDLFHKVDYCDNGVLGLEQYKDFHFQENKYYDLVITDIEMPKMNGIEFATKVRSINKGQDIVVVSAHDDSDYLIEFIDIGIEKFIKKPFESKVLIESLLDVLKSRNIHKIYFEKDIFWDKDTSKLYNDNEEVTLSNSESQLLKLFVNNPNQVFSKYDIFNILEEDSFDAVTSDDSVKSIIKRLRKKLPENAIKNIYGRGYKLNI